VTTNRTDRKWIHDEEDDDDCDDDDEGEEFEDDGCELRLRLRGFIYKILLCTLFRV